MIPLTCLQLSSPHIFLSHDWPQSIEHYGDLTGLLRQKPFFREDINAGKLGSPPLMGLLKTLQPQWWFSAHMHVRFEATVVHNDGPPLMEQPLPGASHNQNPDEIVIEDDEFAGEVIQEASVLPAEGVSGAATQTDISRNPDEIALDDEEDVIDPLPPPPPRKETKFLALDKCLPRRSFLEVSMGG
jgi:lariat debranching enzyme